MDWQNLGVAPAHILLPQGKALGAHWPVVALDQYTSQPEIWQAAEQAIGDAPSTLRLIVPEAFLHESEQRASAAAQSMRRYLDEGILAEALNGFVLVERSTPSGQRMGLVLAIDLEQYDYHPGSRSLIRATEQTVLDRIPPRQAAREQAVIELPHVMLLIDDPQDSVIGPLSGLKDKLPLLYDIELMMDGGHLRGWRVDEQAELTLVASALAALKAALKPGEPLYAVGDGNHSLAAAKATWEKHKQNLSSAELANHPARYALVELVNLHSPALLFEPIHRAVFGSDLAALQAVLAPLKPVADAQAPDITLISDKQDLPLRLTALDGRLVADAVQRLLDEAELQLDYVHGEDALREIAARDKALGILMPPFPKDQLFPTVQRDGSLPRKTFSMGEANEKRFYLEARRIV